MPETRRRDTARREQPVETVPAAQPEPGEQTPETKVSAILVAHNRAAALRRAIEALERSQDRERLEILVVDCGSQDDSPQLDVDYPGITMLRLPRNFGATKAMNIGTRTAKGDFVFYLSPDVGVAPDTVFKLANRLEQDTGLAAVCPLLVDLQGRPVSRIQRIPTREVLAAVCRGRDAPMAEIDLSQESVAVEYPGIDALMVRKQFVKGMNYFDERYGQYWADLDLAMQFRRGLKRILLYPGIRAIKHPASIEADALLAADRTLGAAAFLAKYEGFMAGLGFRAAGAIRALGRMDFKQLIAVVSGQKLDGSQAD